MDQSIALPTRSQERQETNENFLFNINDDEENNMIQEDTKIFSSSSIAILYILIEHSRVDVE